MKKLLKYIKTLQEQPFEGWTEDEQAGYLTALESVKQKIKELKKSKKGHPVDPFTAMFEVDE